MIRQFLLPNPFETLGESFDVKIAGVILPMTPLILNWLIEPFLHVITFAIVGFYYVKGVNNPAVGSFLYLMFYIAHVFLLYLMSLAQFAIWAIVLILVLYFSLHIAINILKNRWFYVQYRN